MVTINYLVMLAMIPSTLAVAMTPFMVALATISSMVVSALTH
jgi:hypothetical protein